MTPLVDYVENKHGKIDHIGQQIRLGEPSELVSIAIGRTPLSNGCSQAMVSVERSITVRSFFVHRRITGPIVRRT